MALNRMPRAENRQTLCQSTLLNREFEHTGRVNRRNLRIYIIIIHPAFDCVGRGCGGCVDCGHWSIIPNMIIPMMARAAIIVMVMVADSPSKASTQLQLS